MPKQALIITEFSKNSIGAFGNRAMFEIAEKMWLIVKGTHKKVENSTPTSLRAKVWNIFHNLKKMQKHGLIWLKMALNAF